MRIHYFRVYDYSKKQTTFVDRIYGKTLKEVRAFLYKKLSSYINDEDLCLLHANNLFFTGNTAIKEKNNSFKYSFEYSYFDREDEE